MPQELEGTRPEQLAPSDQRDIPHHILILNPNHSIIPATRKKVNSIPLSQDNGKSVKKQFKTLISSFVNSLISLYTQSSA